jgi:hypothetical protein
MRSASRVAGVVDAHLHHAAQFDVCMCNVHALMANARRVGGKRTHWTNECGTHVFRDHQYDSRWKKSPQSIHQFTCIARVVVRLAQIKGMPRAHHYDARGISLQLVDANRRTEANPEVTKKRSFIEGGKVSTLYLRDSLAETFHASVFADTIMQEL